MSILVLGLVVFFGVHSLRIFADGWRIRMIAKRGLNGWKGLYALASIVGFVLIIWGFGLARQAPTLLYAPPFWLRHITHLFTLMAFVLVVAAYVPRNHFKAAIGHPMLAGVKIWAFGHLLAVGFLHDVVLFGAFLLWAVVDFIVSRRRDRLAGTTYPAGTLRGDALVLVIGIMAWASFALWLHARWIGVNPFT